MKKIISFASLILLTGCATEFGGYKDVTMRAALANICEQEKYISTEDFARYVDFQLVSGPHQQASIVDDNKMRRMYRENVTEYRRHLNGISEKDSQTLKDMCSEITVFSAGLKRKNSTSVQTIPEYSAPKTTSCRTVQGWTHCSSF